MHFDVKLEEAIPSTVQTSRGPMEYAACGEGPVVLALHGAMGGYDQSLLLARTVGAPGFRYLAVSRPGYLGTPLSAGRTPEEQADLYAEALDALGIQTVGVLAVSGGGPSAMHFALRYPKRCWGVAMFSACSDTLREKLPLAWYIMKTLGRWPAFAASMRKKAEADPDRSARASVTDPVVRARMLADPEASALFQALGRSTMDRLPQRIPGAENDVAQTRKDMRLRPEGLQVPVLVVHGTADPVVPFAQAKALAAKAPRADLLAIEGGEHVTIFTHLADVRARTAQFLHAHAPASLPDRRADEG